MLRNKICGRLRHCRRNMALVLVDAFEKHQARNTGCRLVLHGGQLFQLVPLGGHEPHVDRLIGKDAAWCALFGELGGCHILGSG